MLAPFWDLFGRLAGMIYRLFGALDFASILETIFPVFRVGFAAGVEPAEGGEASPPSHAEDFMRRIVSLFSTPCNLCRGAADSVVWPPGPDFQP